MSEHSEQMALFRWAAYSKGAHPELDLLYAVPNAGKRSYGAARYMKNEGLQAGVPDICLPIPKGDYGALYIEMKFGKNKPTNNQQEWIDKLKSHNNRVEICWGFDEAKDVILDYLSEG
jgi:hypothetical protein